MCHAYQKGKQTKTTHKAKNAVSTTRPLKLLHLDLIDIHEILIFNNRNLIFNDSKYCIDDFSRYTWVSFLRHKNDTFEIFINFCKRVHDGKFENLNFNYFVTKMAMPKNSLLLWHLNKML